MPAQLRDARGRFARPPTPPADTTTEEAWQRFAALFAAIIAVPLLLAGWLAYAVLAGATIIGILYCLHLALHFLIFGSL